MRTRRARVALGVSGAVAIAAVGVGVAWATIPDSSGVVHGCYDKKTGALRVVDNDNACNAKKELPLQWNRKGPQGGIGQQGPKGDQGQQGAKGDMGPAGAAVLFRTGMVGGPFSVPPAIKKSDGSDYNWADVPVSSDAWTQSSDGIDLLYSTITYTVPSTCTLYDGLPYAQPRLALRISRDGVADSPIGTVLNNAPLGSTQTEQLPLPAYLLYTGSAKTRTIRIEASAEACTGANEHHVIQDLRFAVAELR